MKLIRILKNWDYPDIIAQTPGHSGIWEDMQFTLDPVEECDYVAVFNRTPEAVSVRCPPEGIWQFTMEPPVPEYDWLHQWFGHYHRVFTQDQHLHGPKFIHSHGALPWHIGRTYDDLKNDLVPVKDRDLSWVTSSKTRRAGHLNRLKFMELLQAHRAFDLWGRGFTPLPTKWDGLAPYRYTLAVENYSARDYWTEKIADSFLAWCMPIYYGATNITDYFPVESMVIIDINQPDEAIEIIDDAIGRKLWHHQRDAIAHARALVLDDYQFFPFMVAQIRAFEATNPSVIPVQNHLPAMPNLYPKSEITHQAASPSATPTPNLIERIRWKVSKWISRK